MAYNPGTPLSLVLGVAIVAIASAVFAGQAAAGPAGGTSTGGSNALNYSGAAPMSTSSPSSSGVPAGCGLTQSQRANVLTTSNDPSWAAAVNHVKTVAAGALAAGLPSAALHLPYAGVIPDQSVNGVPETGVEIGSECPALLGSNAGPTPTPAGIAYDGQSFRGTHLVNDPTIDSNSLLGTLRVNSDNNFYPDSATPTTWGAQLNAVLANVTILGHRGYAFWVQNVVSYDSHNDTLYFVDDTWNFTSDTSEMQPSSLVSWSPNGSDYTGTWVAFSQYYHAPPPFTVSVYVNSSVNSRDEQVLWYNYTLSTSGHFYHGTYDNLVFRSQVPGHEKPLAPASFEASASTTHLVNEGYEFDAFVGADDGSNQLVLAANATEQLKYCTLRDCTAGRSSYANVPAAVNFGSQTGEESVGVAVNFRGSTALLSGGPQILHGLWNYTGQVGTRAGATEIQNDIGVTGSPVPVHEQPYVFVFFQNAAFGTQTYQWAPDVPDWYLMPGTYHYEILLSDYAERSGTMTVGHSAVALRSTLSYTPSTGVYTPLWAFDDGQVAGIAMRGTGTISSQYVLFNNPTSDCTHCAGAPNGSLSPLFFSFNDYAFKSFAGIFLNGTDQYIDVDTPPSLQVSGPMFGAKAFFLNIQFFETSHVTLSHAAAISGWPAQSEISFYLSVPASQNVAPQADVYVWNSTHDLIMSNNFVAVKPLPYAVSPDQIVLYGGSGNTVWGNTFRDPPGVSLGRSYAGLGIAESGDRIYNNNFSIDNPVVLLPYNFPNVADCLPQCSQSDLGDTWFYNYAHDIWNVTPQAASNVARTVNGFPLSGNILGPDYTVVGGHDRPAQGGNFYWNFGRAPNNRTTIPYVARFLYTDWSNLYPLGCGTIQPPGAPCGTAPPIVGAYENGIQFGGDYAPIIPLQSHVRAVPVSGELSPVRAFGSGVLSLVNPFERVDHAVASGTLQLARLL